MRIFAVIPLLFAGLLTRVTAGEPLGKCFDADTNKFVTIAEAGPTTDYLLTARMPAVQWKGDEPFDLKWIDCPPDVSAQREQIGNYRNRAIYRTIYCKRIDHDEPTSAFICVVFAYQTSDWVSTPSHFSSGPMTMGCGATSDRTLYHSATSRSHWRSATRCQARGGHQRFYVCLYAQ